MKEIKNQTMDTNKKKLKSIGRFLYFWQAVASSNLPAYMVSGDKPYQLIVALSSLYTAIAIIAMGIISEQQTHLWVLTATPFILNLTMILFFRRKLGEQWVDLFNKKLAAYKPNDKLALDSLHEKINEKGGLDLMDLKDWYWKEKMTYEFHKKKPCTISYQKTK